MRFDYIKYNETTAKLQAHFKTQFEKLASDVEALEESRGKSLILTKLEEAYMWVGKALRDQQFRNMGTVEPQEERTNS